MARIPEFFPKNRPSRQVAGRGDILPSLLSTIRLSEVVQFCLRAAGDWRTNPHPSGASLFSRHLEVMPFHVVGEGNCWLRVEGRQIALEAGDLILLPQCAEHELGAGDDGERVNALHDLPRAPWREIPVLHYGDGGDRVRLLCGYVRCDSLAFMPLLRSLPNLIHVQTANNPDSWLNAAIRELRGEVDEPPTGRLSTLQRLTEVAFIEVLRNEIELAAASATGPMAAISDASLSRCLSLIHGDPGRDWSLKDLAVASGMSRSVLTERFQSILGTTPIRYVRDWRLYLASLQLIRTAKPIASIARAAGYATEAAFNRAFSRAFGDPPATWRVAARTNRQTSSAH